MTEEEKKQEILNFLNEKAFKPMIEYGKEPETCLKTCLRRNERDLYLF